MPTKTPGSVALSTAGLVEVLVTFALEMSPRLTSKDTLVLNFGAHYIGSPAHSPVSNLRRGLAAFMRRWAALGKARGDMPRLVWRDTAPQHFASPTGEYNQTAVPDGEPEHYPCQPLSAERVSWLLKDPGSYVNLHRKAFIEAVQCAGLKLNDRSIALLPLWRASQERVTEHRGWADFNAEKKAFEGNVYDCGHYCRRSSVNLYWNAALANLIKWMQRG